jgi:hypothetical protein
MTKITAKSIYCGFRAKTGLLDGFTVEDEGQTVSPLHRAPWVGTDEAMPPDEAPLMATLGGDFFCAPFASSEDDSPLHGWPPNSRWKIVADQPGVMRAVLEHMVFGATLLKELSLKDDHPFVYQRHVFVGGHGRVSFANHANVSLPNGGLIRTSAKSMWETPKTPQESDPERGRSDLVCPAQTQDPKAFPAKNGPVDLTTYPWNPRHEDFVVGIEARGHRLGWTAVTRPEERDLYLSLRNPAQIPMTMLWHSNGGRDYPPWSGRHFGCLGVEEGAADHMLGLSTEADLTGPGALTLSPDGIADVRHVIGAIHWPSGEGVSDISETETGLRIKGERGATRDVAFDTAFLRLT